MAEIDAAASVYLAARGHDVPERGTYYIRHLDLPVATAVFVVVAQWPGGSAAEVVALPSGDDLDPPVTREDYITILAERRCTCDHAVPEIAPHNPFCPGRPR